jgi:hypothetical protein
MTPLSIIAISENSSACTFSVCRVSTRWPARSIGNDGKECILGIITFISRCIGTIFATSTCTVSETFWSPHLAGLSPKYVPTLQEILLELNKGKEKRKEEKLERDKQHNRSVYFCIGYSTIWKEPIHKKLRNKFDLRWLQISLSYHRFSNMREMMAGDLSKKLSEGVKSLDFKVLDCNCRGGRGPDKCQYRNYCRMPIVI